MRILFVTNFYPPYERGGQGQSCQDVVEGLKQRGHQTLVLTTRRGNITPVENNGVHMLLYLETDLKPWRQSINFFINRKRREQYDLQCFERMSGEFNPDIIFIWGMWNLPRSLPAFIEANYSHKVIYRLADYWPTLPSQHENYWRIHGGSWFTYIPKLLLAQVALVMLRQENHPASLNFKHVICISKSVQQELLKAGVPVAHARIIHNGVDVEKFLRQDKKLQQSDHENQSVELVYVGRLSLEKGVDIAIETVAVLVSQKGYKNLKLTLVGNGPAKYVNQLRQLIAKNKLEDYVSFLGYVPPDNIPALLKKFDILLFPSVWVEPFGRVVLEAMMSEVVVVATPTGGPGEVIVDGQNGLFFTTNDPEDLAQKVSLLIDNPNMRRKLAQAAQRTVMENFTMNMMLDKVESYLSEVCLFAEQNKEINLGLPNY